MSQVPATADHVDDLTTMVKKPLEVTLTDGTVVPIRSVTVDGTPKMLRAVARVIPILRERGVFLTQQQIKNREMPALSGDVWLDMIADSMDVLVELVEVGTQVPPEQLKAMELDDFFTLTLGVINKNYDFFIKRLLPHLERLMVKAAEEATKSQNQLAGQA